MPGCHQHSRALRALAGALCLSGALALPAAAGAAEGGPSLNIPVPAPARTVPAGGAAAPAAGTATAPAAAAPAAGAASAPAATTTATVPAAGAATPGTIPTQTTGTAPAVAGAHPTARRTSGTSGAAVAIAVLAVLLALGCAVWAIARSRAFEPRWTLSLRHSMAEAGYRASATWAELTDWFRLGH
jgi:cobalamin biosynthesis Mg chelatase CobN